MTYLPYAGIGSRETPDDVLDLMAGIGKRLAELGFTLRSGGAQGADTAFETYVPDRLKEIFIPWEEFQNRSSREAGVFCGWPSREIEEAAYEIAAQHHPNWDACSRGARALHARNVAQIRGHELFQPAQFVVCWTKAGACSGGTGQALRMAWQYRIPIFNLGMENQNTTLVKLGKFVKHLTGQEP